MDLFEEYSRVYRNYDKSMACLEDIVMIAAKQGNYEIGKRIETLFSELEPIPKSE